MGYTRWSKISRFQTPAFAGVTWCSIFYPIVGKVKGHTGNKGGQNSISKESINRLT
jgi:hypothetical protein